MQFRSKHHSIHFVLTHLIWISAYFPQGPLPLSEVAAYKTSIQKLYVSKTKVVLQLKKTGNFAIL